MKTEPNPFESPGEAATDSAEHSFRLRNWVVELILISEPIALVGLAFAHRCQLESHPTVAMLVDAPTLIYAT